MTLHSRPSRIRAHRSLGTQAIALAAGTAIAQVIVAVMYVLTARDAGPTAYGQLVAAIAVGGSAMGFFDFGTSSYWIRERASGRMDHEDFSAGVTKKIAIAALLFVTAVIVCIFWFPSFIPACVIFLSGTVSQAALVPLRAARRGEVVAVLSITERAAALSVFLVLMLSGVDPLNGLWTALVSGTLVMGFAAYLSSKGSGRARLKWKRNANPWRGAKFYGLSSVASSAQQLDLPLLTAVAGTATAGIYGGVNRWTQPMGVLATAFSSASAPFIAHAQDWRTTKRMVTRASWLLVVAVGVCVALAFCAPWVVELLLGPEFATSAPVLQWLAIGTIPAILNQPLAAALQARRYDHLVAAVYLGSVVVQLGLVASLGFALGALGAAIAFFLLQVIMLTSLSVCVAVAVKKDKRVMNHEVSTNTASEV